VKHLLFILMLLLPLLAQAQTTPPPTNVNLTWTPPTLYEDDPNTPENEGAVALPASDITGYVLFRLTAAGAEEFIANLPVGTSAKVRLPIGQHNLFMRTVGTGGTSKGRSNIVSVTIKGAPGVPTNVQATVTFTVTSAAAK